MDALAREVARRAAARKAKQEAAIARRAALAAARPAKALPGAGETFEDTALPLLEEARREWLEKARGIAIDLAVRLGDITINDVRDRIQPPEDVDGRCMGAVLRNVKATEHLGRWERVHGAAIDSSRARGRPLCVFRWIPVVDGIRAAA